MIGCSFQGTDGNDLSVQDFAKGMPETDDTSEAASIQVWNGTTLVPYYYIAYDFDAEDNLLYGWVDGDQNLADFDTPPGFACWLRSPAAFTLTIAGQVVDAAETTIDLAANAWKLVANPYPIAVELNGGKIDGSGLPQVDDVSEAALIQFWNGSTLVPYYYIAYDFDAEDNLLYGWVDGDQTVADLTIPVHTGFWARSPIAATLKWKK